MDSFSIFDYLPNKLYTAVSGTSTLITGLILIFEWWYTRKYGTSFIKQVTCREGPWINGADVYESSDRCPIYRESNNSSGEEDTEDTAWAEYTSFKN